MKDALLALGDLFDLLPDAVIVIDGKGKVVHTNYSVTPVLGYRQEELVGESLSILIPERYRSLHQTSNRRLPPTRSSNVNGVSTNPESIASIRHGSAYIDFHYQS